MIRIVTTCIAWLLPVLTLAGEYDRGDWTHWEDFDSDCQNTRHELLIRKSLIPVTFTSDTGCYVATGAWHGPFTGQVYTQATQLDVDHVIALRYAHEYGGAEWPPLLKKVFANDPENLLAVERGENRSKGWDGPSQYMPPDESYHCEYARLWLHLVRKYELEPAPADKLAITGTLGRCD
ncbi:MAG: DUF1524 domain-containing protein [Pseudohongiellaceae bacterium]